jgi:NADH-quinone oxidoreductase subunit E
MARLTPENETRAREIIGRYPQPRSALIPLLHLAQEQDGWVTDAAMEHIAELLQLLPAEVLGTCSFYEMFKREPVGRYVINVCTNISCGLLGADALLEHAEKSLGVKAGGTTADGQFTLEEAECLAACTEAPMCQVNYRYFYRLTAELFDTLVSDLRAGRLDEQVPRHGVLARIRQQPAPGRWAGSGKRPPGPPEHWSADEPALRQAGSG